MIFSFIYGAIIHVRKAMQSMVLNNPVPAGLIVNNREINILVIKTMKIFIFINALCWSKKLFTLNLRIIFLFKDRQYNEALYPNYNNLKKYSDRISQIKV